MEHEIEAARPAGWVDDFNRLYEAERHPMLRVCFLIVGSTAVAEDLVQDAFVELYRRWDTVDNTGGYLRRAVVNRSLNWLRRGKVEHRYLAVHEHVDRSSDPPEEPMWALMATLPAAQRAALVLTYYLDLSSEDAAEHLGCRPATVRSLVRRGLAALRKDLK